MLAFGAAGAVFVAVYPEMVLGGPGHSWVATAIHLFTLGSIFCGAMALQILIWERLYGGQRGWHRLWPLILLVHVVGLGVMLAGLLPHDVELAYWGGHYLVPTSIVLAAVQGWRAAAKRPRGTPRHLAAHLPGFGLLLVMSLGAMLVMDAATGDYGIYLPGTIFVHLLTGGFLFVLPQIWCAQAVLEREAAPHDEKPVNFLPLYQRLMVASAGVLAVTLAIAQGGGAENAAPGGTAMALPLGLALLGAVMLWDGMSGDRPLPLRTGWIFMGAILLWSALRLLRGEGPEGHAEALALAKLGVPFFLLGVALPEFSRMQRWGLPMANTVTWSLYLLLAGSLLLGMGQMLIMPGLARAGMLVWLIGWLAGGFSDPRLNKPAKAAGA